MRICMVTTSFPRFSGDFAGIFVRGLARGLVRRGVDVVVVCPHAPGCAMREAMDGIEVRRFRYFLPASLQRLAYGSGIASNLRHSHLAMLQVPLLGMAGARAVYTASAGADLIHAFWTISGVLAAPAAKLRRLPMQLKLLGSGIRSAPRLLNRLALACADTIEFGPGAFEHDLEPYAYRGPVEHIRAFPDFERVAASTALEAELAAWCRSGKDVVTFTARFEALKDPLGVIRAIPHVLQHRPQTRFLLVGDGPLRQEMHALIEQLGLAACVRLTGVRTDVGAILRASTVFVANSPVTNCFSSSILEALYAGVPVVVTDVGDPSGAFKQKDYVELVQPENPQDLARGIVRLLANPELRSRRAVVGRQLLTDLGFEPEVILDRTMASYQRLCSKRKPLEVPRPQTGLTSRGLWHE